MIISIYKNIVNVKGRYMLLKSWKASWEKVVNQGFIWRNKQVSKLIQAAWRSPIFGIMLLGVLFTAIGNIVIYYEIFQYHFDVIETLLVYLFIFLLFSFFICSYIYKSYHFPYTDQGPKNFGFVKKILKSIGIIFVLHVMFALFFILMFKLAQIVILVFIDQSSEQITSIIFYTSWPVLVFYARYFIDQIFNFLIDFSDMQGVFTLFTQNIFLWINPWVMFALLYLWDSDVDNTKLLSQKKSVFSALRFSFKQCLFNYPLLVVNHLYVLILVFYSEVRLGELIEKFINSGVFSWWILLWTLVSVVWILVYLANIFNVYELSKEAGRNK